MAEVFYSDSIEIDAPPEVVFDYRVDFTNLPAYNEHVTNVRRTDDGAKPGAGAEYVFELRLPGAPEALQNPLRVLTAARPSQETHETGPGYMAHGVDRFEPTGSGTRITIEYTLTFPGDLPAETIAAAEASGRADVRLELELMKKILEG